MSTFDGKVAEFPDIRIDYFRSDPTSRPPLASFLSHVHSDHLVGLESCKSPFIYCTPATRDIVLRLEKYPHRMNFAKGILETRTQTYRHLKTLLKAIPLETPTTIELAPGREVRVTLFDANHCVGACMFLIEGSGKAVLYSGDIRSEAWWVDSLVRHPVLLPYASPPQGRPMRRLDCIYLDTTFVVTGRQDPYREFASKAQGIDELLRKVAQYPSDTLFYFDSWTFGYEEVWQALASFLGSRIHVDDYRYGLYLALTNGVEPKAPEGRRLIGYHCGNHFQQGSLTTVQSRVHSCEKGTGCEIWTKDFVRITPIVSRYQGTEMAELGAGGGQSDLNQRHELEFWNSEQVGQLMALCTSKLSGQPKLLSGVLQLLTSVISDGVKSIALDDFPSTAQTRMLRPGETGLLDLDGMSLDKLIPALAKLVTNMRLKKSQSSAKNSGWSPVTSSLRADGLPKQITFPYSRHSSYNELCLLLEAFKPKDIFPCTVDESNWSVECSMDSLFGHIYHSVPHFRHDQYMAKKRGLEKKDKAADLRPVSASSASNEYATPDEGDSRHYDSNNETQRARKRSSDEIRGELNSSETEAKRQRTTRRSRGDFSRRISIDHYSPPVDNYDPVDHYSSIDHYEPRVDHHSPPSQKPQTRSTIAAEEQASHGPVDSDPWPNLTDVERAVPGCPIRNRQQKPIVQSRYPDESERALFGDKQGGRRRQSLAYGRLSPHGEATTIFQRRPDEQYQPQHVKATALIEYDFDENHQRRQQKSLSYGRLSPPLTAKKATVNEDDSPSPISRLHRPSSQALRESRSVKPSHKAVWPPAVSKKMAFRKEAYNAVLGLEGCNWNDIGLVSVSGHQIREEEL